MAPVAADLMDFSLDPARAWRAINADTAFLPHRWPENEYHPERFAKL